jgi:F0F1-type ATP synthase membrane subunit b/b'
MEILNSMLGQLGIDRSFFVMLAMFVVTFAVFNFLALKKLTDTVVERSKRTEGRENQAGHAKEELEGIRAELQAGMKEARSKAHAEFLSIRGKALEEQRNIVNIARGKATDELRGARADLQNRLGAEVQKLEKDIPAISKAIVDKLLEAPRKASAADASVSFGAE